jgi:hypothetical protein
MSFNVHSTVRGAVQAINKDTPGTVYVSTGRTNVRGILTPTYAPVSALLQVQGTKHSPLIQQRGLEYSNAFLTVYAFGDFSDIERPAGTGGDIIAMNGGWYYISQVFEWWPDWSSFEVTRQLNAADLATFLAALQNGTNPP